ncbi:MAG: nucleotidyltransferase family protein [Candidatus Coatesbacteria bacterium]|nr:nucleotidyltransferase family protein [Candidatus Coatesbacteria bacterium]
MASKDKLRWVFAKPHFGFKLDEVSSELLNLISYYPLTEDDCKKAFGLAEKMVDWDIFFSCSENQKTIQTIGYHLDNDLSDLKVPELMKEKTIDKYKSNLAFNIIRTEKIMRFIDRIAKDHEVIILKGLLFNEVIYDNPGLRSMVDFDIMVRLEDLENIEKLLKEMGLNRPREKKFAAWENRSHHLLFEYKTTEASLLIEVHRLLFTEGIIFPDYNDIWKNIIPVNFSNETMYRMDNERLCLYTILTLAMQSFAINLRRLIDIVTIANSFPINWDIVRNLAQKWQANNFLEIAALIMKSYYPEISFKITKQVSLPSFDKKVFNYYFDEKNYRFYKYNFTFHRHRLNAYFLTEKKVNYFKLLSKSLFNAILHGYPD